MSYYEPYSELSQEAREFDRVVQSLMEELEALNFYNQRADVTKDESVKELMIHNRDEEIEHACMLMEWLRRNSEPFDEQLRIYMFTEEAITEVEEEATEGGGDSAAGGSSGSGYSSLGIGSMRK